MNRTEVKIPRRGTNGSSKKANNSNPKKPITEKKSVSRKSSVGKGGGATGGRASQTLGVREIARRAGLDASGVSRILAGKRTSARLDTIKKIADVMGVSLDQVYKIMRNPRLRGVK